MITSRAFNDGYSGATLEKAKHSSARMGYNFHVSEVAVTQSSTAGQVDVDVTLNQVGVVPFYYNCTLSAWSLIAQGFRLPRCGEVTMVLFSKATRACFSSLGFPLLRLALKQSRWLLNLRTCTRHAPSSAPKETVLSRSDCLCPMVPPVTTSTSAPTSLYSLQFRQNRPLRLRLVTVRQSLFSRSHGSKRFQ